MLDAIIQTLGALGLAAEIATMEPAEPVSQGGASAAPAYQAPLAAENQSDWHGGPTSDPTEAERADTLEPLRLEREPELAR